MAFKNVNNFWLLYKHYDASNISPYSAPFWRCPLYPYSLPPPNPSSLLRPDCAVCCVVWAAWGQTLVWVLTLLVELGVYVLIIYSATRLFQIDVDWEARTVSSKTGNQSLSRPPGLCFGLIVKKNTICVACVFESKTHATQIVFFFIYFLTMLHKKNAQIAQHFCTAFLSKKNSL